MLNNIKNFNLPEIEERVLEYWKKNKIFEKSLALRAGGKTKRFRFFEGPPSANGKPGVHHVLSRSFKDIILRYKAMRGYSVVRKAGWDTHGLPVEIAVEKELGIKNKAEIEKLGIAEFNERARMLVWKYKNEWERLTERIGFWLDFEKPYITYDNPYIESLWWIFKRISDKGFLKKLYKIVAWCPRCQTPLSNHELGQPDVYRKVKDPSVYVKFELKRGKAAGKNKEYLLVWTTTPWTLPANMAVAVNPKLTYTKYKIGTEFYWSYNHPPKSESSEISVVEKIAGKNLVGLAYKPLYEYGGKKINPKSYQVIAGDFVAINEGTGLVHIAPAFGEDDLKAVTKIGFSASEIPLTIDDRGFMLKGIPGSGKFIKDADKDIVADLLKRGLLYYQEFLEHEYPFCWRCSTPLIYFARLTWFIEMSRLREELLEANRKINWIPEHIKEGRFGEWLKEVKDWSISRERYWGTPLPIWECDTCSERVVVGSLKELDDRAYSKNRFYLVRHGEAQHNITQTMAFVPEPARHTAHLTELGRAQALEMAKALKAERVNIIFASPHRRARDTAKAISKATGAKVIIDKRLSEIDVGTFKGGHFERYIKSFSSLAERFTKRPPGGETLSDVRKRMFIFLRDTNAKYAGKRIVIVSHGDPLRVLDAALRGVPDGNFDSVPTLKVGTWRETAFHNWPYDYDGRLDCHRPFVDSIVLRCERCSKKMHRVKEVADVWFDSGAMPFAEWHYPFEHKDLIDKHQQFPADYISEGIDQTRGWFYTLLSISVLLGLGAPYRNVISTGLLLDKHGQKMSKSKGNVVDPWEITKKYGVDVLRWYFYTINDPGDPKKFDEADLLKAYRKFHLLFYNSYVFLKTYSVSVASSAKNKGKSANLLDRWIAGRLHETVFGVTKHLDDFGVGQAARLLEGFVDDLSHWYIRRSRRRFSDPVSTQDFSSAASTLRSILIELVKLTAPFCPFLSEAIYLTLSGSQGSEKKSASVHLEYWPVADKKMIDKKLISQVDRVRRLASTALALRAEAGIKVRQPLQALKIRNSIRRTADETRNNTELMEMLKDEINVKEIIFGAKTASNTGIELDLNISEALYKEGIMRELIRAVQKVRQDAGYKIGDAILLRLGLPREIASVAEEQVAYLKKAIKAKTVVISGSSDKLVERFDVQAEIKIGEAQIVIGVKKA